MACPRNHPATVSTKRHGISVHAMRPPLSSFAAAMMAAAVFACGRSTPARDAGALADSGIAADGGVADGGPLDAGVADAGSADAGAIDAGSPVWRSVAATGPEARWGHVAVWDARRSRMVVFGGAGPSGRLGDTWAFFPQNEQWQRIDAPDGPTGRYTSAAVIDHARDRMIVMGGDDGRSSNEVWSLLLATHQWSRLPAGPTARFDAAAAGDEARAWFFGGFDASSTALNDLWELNLVADTWRELPDDGALPSERTNMGLAYHAGSLYVTGGHDEAALTPGTWRYDLTSERWIELHPSGSPVAGAHYAYAFDPLCRALYLAGGDNNDNVDVAVTDILVLDPTVRFARLSSVDLPPARRHSALVLDPARRELLLFGGSYGPGTARGDTWRYSLGNCP